MERTTVCRIYGNSELGGMIANTLAQPELKRLRAEVGVSKPVRSEMYRKMIMEAKKKYAIKPIPVWRERMWGFIGLMVVLAKEGFVQYDPR